MRYRVFIGRAGTVINPFTLEEPVFYFINFNMSTTEKNAFQWFCEIYTGFKIDFNAGDV